MKRALWLALAVLLLAPPAGATETRVVVHVLAHDAKLIGDAAGGCAVTLRDATTGEVLAAGEQRGGTGSTDRIVREPWVRGESRLDTEGAAAFAATLDLDAPTRVEIAARGPLGFATSQFSTRRTVLLLPGHHVEGDGIVLTLQGLIVNLQEPDPEDPVVAGAPLAVEVGVKLLCTCPITEDSLWPAASYSVRAELLAAGEVVASAELAITDRTNVFAGEIAVPAVAAGESAEFELRVTAANDATANFGMDSAVFRVRG